MPSCFHREADEIYALLGYKAAYGGNYLPKFPDKIDDRTILSWIFRKLGGCHGI
jgi:hypothetical protein